MLASGFTLRAPDHSWSEWSVPSHRKCTLAGASDGTAGAGAPGGYDPGMRQRERAFSRDYRPAFFVMRLAISWWTERATATHAQADSAETGRSVSALASHSPTNRRTTPSGGAIVVVFGHLRLRGSAEARTGGMLGR